MAVRKQVVKKESWGMGKVTFWIQANKMTAMCWNHIRKHYPARFKEVMDRVHVVGGDRVRWGLTDDLKPIAYTIDF